MTMTILNGPFIRAGESISAPVQILDGQELVRLTMPGNWTSAKLTFRISTDGLMFNDLFGADGAEITIFVQPGVAVLVDPKFQLNDCYVQFRSGSREKPVIQPEEREFALALRSVKRNELTP